MDVIPCDKKTSGGPLILTSYGRRYDVLWTSIGRQSSIWVCFSKEIDVGLSGQKGALLYHMLSFVLHARRVKDGSILQWNLSISLTL